MAPNKQMKLIHPKAKTLIDIVTKGGVEIAIESPAEYKVICEYVYGNSSLLAFYPCSNIGQPVDPRNSVKTEAIFIARDAIQFAVVRELTQLKLIGEIE